MPMSGNLFGTVFKGKGYQNYGETALADAANRYSGLGAEGDLLSSTYKSTFQPLYTSLASEAAYRPDLVNRAGIDAANQAENYRGQMERNMTRMGVNPNSGRWAGLEQQWALKSAADKAGAMTRAAREERDGSFNKLLGLAGLGQGVMSAGISAKQSGAGGLMNVAGEYGSLASAQAEKNQTMRERRDAEKAAQALQDAEDDRLRQQRNERLFSEMSLANQGTHDAMRSDWMKSDMANWDRNRRMGGFGGGF